MPNGYHGKILHINLTDRRLWVEEPDTDFYRLYMGGGNFGLHYILKHMPRGADPLGPDNVLTLMDSVVTGVSFSGQSRMTANAKSPLTGAIGDSQSGGFFPAELKFAGFDGMVFYGKANVPVYLWVHDGEYELRDAGDLWGLGSWDTETRIRQELGDDQIEVICVGPSGERLVRFAAIMNMRNRAFGRTGMGAVMGSKNLKAVAVRGHGKPELFDASGVKRISKLGAHEYKANRGMTELGELGTASVVAPQDEMGGFPTFNYKSGHFEHWKDLSGETLAETILVGRDTCYACVVRCKREVEIEGEYRVKKELGGPEYESIATLGSYCGVRDLAAISLANANCNDWGLDTIAAGATIAWAMECFEDGLLTLEDTNGIELRMGDPKAMLAALEALAFRTGRLGDLLAEGSLLAAKQIGPEAVARTVTVKGSELPAHMPQVKRSMGLIYAVNPFGADHQTSEHDTSYEESSGPMSLGRLAYLGLTTPVSSTDLGPEKVEFTLLTHYWMSATDVLNLCQFDWGATWQLYGPEVMVDVVNVVTGWDITRDELLEVGARRINMQRAFNAREGFTREQDTLPQRIYEPLVGGASDGMVVTEEEIERAKDLYYRMAGWDVETGNPDAERLDELGIGWVATTTPKPISSRA
jgi:aldehyde:ferredoxin oxidoreductase